MPHEMWEEGEEEKMEEGQEDEMDAIDVDRVFC